MSRVSDLSPSPAAFERELLNEMPVLYRVARRLTGNDSDAEDLVGQVLLIAVRSRTSFDGRHLRSWLVKILKNERLGQIRRRQSRPEVQMEEIVEPSDEGFWEKIRWREVGDRLLVELDRLPEEYRMAVVLCDVEGMSYDEACLAMEVPVGTVRSRLFRGRRILRSRLAHLVGEENQ